MESFSALAVHLILQDGSENLSLGKLMQTCYELLHPSKDQAIKSITWKIEDPFEFIKKVELLLDFLFCTFTLLFY